MSMSLGGAFTHSLMLSLSSRSVSAYAIGNQPNFCVLRFSPNCQPFARSPTSAIRSPSRKLSWFSPDDRYAYRAFTVGRSQCEMSGLPLPPAPPPTPPPAAAIIIIAAVVVW
uniref:Putative secreted protein n=1 Tax=Anopheles triannulatus TaxID=58253 RepID=A0A2M4B0V3_9DIPT